MIDFDPLRIAVGSELAPKSSTWRENVIDKGFVRSLGAHFCNQLVAERPPELPRDYNLDELLWILGSSGHDSSMDVYICYAHSPIHCREYTKYEKN